MTNLQERGVLFVSPGEDCYEGMLVGENARAADLDVNITKAKQMTNVRSNADVLVRLGAAAHCSASTRRSSTSRRTSASR